MHRAHRELTVRAAEDIGADDHIVVHPVVDLTQQVDIDHHTRVKVYKQILKKYPDGLATISSLPLAMRMGGHREALWYALIRMNYGVDHFIVGRDLAGPGKNSKGVDFYGSYDAQKLLDLVEDELKHKSKIVPFRMVTYLPDEDRSAPIDTIDTSKIKTANISATELRQRLKDGTEISAWFSFPEVVKILRESYPPRYSQGFTVVIKSADKLSDYFSTALQSMLNQFSGGRRVTKLDEAQGSAYLNNEFFKGGNGLILLLNVDFAPIVAAVSKENLVVVLADPADASGVQDVALTEDIGSSLAQVTAYLKEQGL